MTTDEEMDEILRHWGRQTVAGYAGTTVEDLVTDRPVTLLGPLQGREQSSGSTAVTRSRRYNWRGLGPSIAAVAVVAAGITTATVAASRHDHKPGGTASGAPVAALRDGQHVQAYGQVMLRSGSRGLFCPEFGHLLPYILRRDGKAAAAPVNCAPSVTLDGADPAALWKRTDVAGVISGYAQIQGTYSAGTLTVSRQRGVSQSSLNQGPPGPPPDSVPCATPSGGWPRGGDRYGNLDDRPVGDWSRQHPGEVVRIALLRPSATKVIMYVLTKSPQTTIVSDLSKTYGGRICAAQSKYSTADVSAALKFYQQRTPNAALTLNTIYGSGEGMSTSGQPEVSLEVGAISEDLIKSTAQFPPGLIRINPWLKPV